MEYDFFISHCSANAEVVKEVVENIEKTGAKCWMAPRDVVGRYAKAIIDAIAESKIFLLFLSKEAATSEHVLNEVEMALKCKKTTNPNLMIQPVCIENIDIDAPELDEIMYYIRRINFIVPSSFEKVDVLAKEVLEKNKDILNIKLADEKKERDKSSYIADEFELNRLKKQNDILKKFNGDIYNNIFDKYDDMKILDIGCSVGDAIIDRLSGRKYKLLGIDINDEIIKKAKEKYENENATFCMMNVEDANFSDNLLDKMDEIGIEKFDVIHIGSVLLHLKSMFPVLRKLRRMLDKNGTILIVDIDDGINYAYPDDDGIFEHMYELCIADVTSGERHNARQIFTNLVRAGYKNIKLEKSGLHTIDMSQAEKETFFDMYFGYLLPDFEGMLKANPNDTSISKEYAWLKENDKKARESFMNEDFVFSLGYQVYTAGV